MTRSGASWVRVETGDGSVTLAHPAHGQTCHSRAGAWTEARERYASACRLKERARTLAREGCRAFRLCDVGTGLGLNLAAALEALEGTGLALDAVSFEIDPRVIEETLRLGPAPISELERRHAPVRVALARALEAPLGAPIELEGGSLRLFLGDARATLGLLEPRHAFDAVFLDPFSPAVDPPLWEREFLAALARRMAPGSLLSTYTVSLGVRAALHAAGLTVGLGPRVGTKAEGTLAGPAAVLEALDPKTRRRVEARAASGASAAGEIRPGRELPAGR